MISTAELVFDNNCEQWVQIQSFKSKLDKVPVNLEIAWEGYIYLGKHLPSKEVVNKSVEVRTTAVVADAGYTVLSAVL